MNSLALYDKATCTKKYNADEYTTYDKHASHYTDSDELFSDEDENRKPLNDSSPGIVQNDCSTLNLSETSLLQICQPETPNTAVVPSTPLSLLPYITKINDQWSSDLETPQTNRTNKGPYASLQAAESAEKNISIKQLPPSLLDITNEEKDYTSISPIIKNRKVKRGAKRRIFKSIQSPEIILQSPIRRNAQNPPQVLSESNTRNITQAASIITKTLTQGGSHNLKNLKENRATMSKLRKIQEDSTSSRQRNMNLRSDTKHPQASSSHNTSTQNFFNDMSFTNIDKICLENMQTESSPLSSNVAANDRENVKKSTIRGYEDRNLLNVKLCKNNVNQKNPNLRKSKLPLSKSTDFGLHTPGKNRKQNIFSNKETKGYKNPYVSKNVYIEHSKENREEGTGNLDESFGFQTASGRNIAVSKEALKKALLMFPEECENNESENEIENESQNKIENLKTDERNQLQNEVFEEPDFLGFEPAECCPTSASEIALQKFKFLFSEEKDDVDDTSIENKHAKSENVIKMDKRGNEPKFQTASGRDIAISKEALKKASLMFSEESEKYESENERQNKTENLKTNEKNQLNNKVFEEPDFLGFKTAGGRQITVSETALQKAKFLFSEDNDDVDDTSIENKHAKSENVINMEKRGNEPKFQTASGREIAISKEALKKASLMFSEESEKHESENKIENLKTNDRNQLKNKVFEEPDVLDFEPAGHRQISVKDNDDVDDTSIENKHAKSENIIKMDSPGDEPAFQTASGRSISISKNALERAIQMFSEENNNANDQGISKQSSGNHTVVNTQRSDAQTDCKLTRTLQSFSTENPLQRGKLSFGKKESIEELNIRKEHGTNHLEKKVQIQNSSIQDKVDTSRIKSLGGLHRIESQPRQKRKSRDSDEDTPLGKYSGSHFKKLRFNSNLQVRKLTYEEDSSTSIINKNLTETSDSVKNIATPKESNTSTSTSSHSVPVEKRIESGSGNYVNSESQEILASTAALLADDGQFLSEESSPSKIKKVENVETTPVSPVIGRQSYLQRRRNMALRRNNTVLSKKNQDIFPNCDKRKVETTEADITQSRKECISGADAEFGDTQLIMNFIHESETVLEKRLAAAAEQDKLIKCKLRNKAKPTVGRLLSCKKNSSDRLSWRKLSNNKPPIPRTFQELINMKIAPKILHITPGTAAEFRFRCADYYSDNIVQNNTKGLDVGEGTLLIMDENGYAGVPEVKRAFLAIPGVDPALVPNYWIENHYKWIVWKLASIDRMKFDSINLPRMLTPSEVMAQLKYRYDREIDRSERSALRKILEKDDVSSKRMVLCVSEILKNTDSDQSIENSPRPMALPLKKLIVTDGWYSIPAVVDHAMIKNIISGKVKQGTKLLTYGAELLHCEHGCSPLEIPSNVYLKLHTNSTRRARWDVKMGYVHPLGPFPLRLKNLDANGGLVGKVIVIVARVYAVLYHEKLSSGESIFRNERCEEKASIAYTDEWRTKIESIYALTEKLLHARKSSAAQTDSIVSDAAKWNKNYEKLLQEISLPKEEYDSLLKKYYTNEDELKRRLHDRLQKNLPRPRKVTPILKVRVVEDETSAVLTIWSPSEDVIDMMKEGSCISVCNVSASGKRVGEIQLTAGRNSVFNLKSTCNVLYPRREYTPLCDVNKSSFSPAYNEFDTVGIIVSVGSAPYGMKYFEAVHIAYPQKDSNESFYLSILFWQGASNYGFAEILTIGSVIACSNLEWRRTVSKNIPIAYCTERTAFTRNPRQNYFREAFSDLKTSLSTKTNAFIEKCAVEIAEEIEKKPMARTPNTNSGKFNAERNVINDNIAGDASPCGLSSDSRAVRSAEIHRRIDKLQCYGEPPKLYSIVLNNSSNRVNMEYKSPIRPTTKSLK